jgi:AcrR family transcriptional regulator
MVSLIVIFAFFIEMNIIDSGSEKSNKVQMIIEAAQKRFGLFGIEKTSMREIGEDLHLSKASLYYYFPDKESLFTAVIEKEQNEFLARISEKVLDIKDPEQIIREYVTTRLSYFRTLLNISRLRFETYSDLKPVFRTTIRSFKEKEKEIIVKVFEQGIQKGIFSIKDPDKTASLFLDLLKGLRVSVVNDKTMLFIEQEEFDKLLENTIAFTEIFINGLRIRI